MAFREILMLLWEKMIKPVQDYTVFSRQIGRRRSRGAAWSVSNCASVPVELIPIIRKRITRCTLHRLRVFHFIRPIHQTRVIRPQESRTSLTLLPKSSSLIFSSPFLSSSLLSFRHRHCYMPPVIHFMRHLLSVAHLSNLQVQRYTPSVTITPEYVPEYRVKKMHYPKLENWRIILLGKSRENRRF